MKIGIDIDGTITTPFYWLDFYNKKLNTNLKPKDINTYEHQLAFGITLRDFNTFRNKYLKEIHKLAHPRYDASRYINQLFFQHHDIFIITAREKKLQPLTHKWLQDYKILYKSLHHLGSTEKTGLALEKSINIFLEDRLETAIDMIKRQIPTILFNTPYNQGYEHPLLIRVDNWQQAYQVIQAIDKKNKSQELKVLDSNTL